MKNIFISIIISVFISSCCSWDFDKEDFEFDNQELGYLAPYEVNDTIYFQSNLGHVDTIVVIKLDDMREEGSTCLISKAPVHQASVTIKHLSMDKRARKSTDKGKRQPVFRT